MISLASRDPVVEFLSGFMICRRILGLLVLVNSCIYASSSGAAEFAPFLTEADWAVTEINDPTGLAPAAVVQRFELHPGDCVSKPPFNDCRKGVERAELGQTVASEASSNVYWYRWKVFFPQDYKSAYPARNRHGQFVDQGAGGSAWAFEIGSTGALWFGSQFDDESRYFSVINGQDLRGQWHEVIVEAVWSGSNGKVNVWVNEEQRVRYQGVTCDRCRIALTYGIARNGVNQFKKRYPQETLPVQIAYYLPAEAHVEDPGWIVVPPPLESEQATDDAQVNQKEVSESESSDEAVGSDEVQPAGESAASEETENDSSAAGVEEEEKALDSVTIVPAAEPASMLDKTEGSDAIKPLSSGEEGAQVVETDAESEVVEETIGSDVELQNASGSETEAASVAVTGAPSTGVNNKPPQFDIDYRR